MAEVKAIDSSKMGVLPEGKLLLTMAVPMMLSMMVQALYNVVDSIYVARVSEDCLTALSLVFPAQNLMIGLGTGTGVGITTLISRALGAGNKKQAKRISGNAILLAIVCWVVVALLGLFLSKAFIYSQTDIQSIRDYAYSYLMIVTVASLFLYFEICVEKLLQSTGLTKLSMWTQMVGAVTNIILDPFFIFGWCGLPKMDTAGAAVATVIGQGFGAALGLFFHFKYNKEIRFKLSDLKPEFRLIGDVYRIGFPSILMMGITSVTNYIMNRLLITFNSTTVAVYGAYFKFQSFFVLPAIGINNAMIPIIGYNYGARKPDRIKRTYKFGIIYATSLLALGFLAFELIPEVLLSIFSPSQQMLDIGVPALRIIGIHFLLAGYCVVSAAVCQALGKSMYSFFISMLRQLVALVPAAYLLSLTGNVQNVWWCFPIAEVVSVICSTLFRKRAFRNLEPLYEPVQPAADTPAAEL